MAPTDVCSQVLRQESWGGEEAQALDCKLEQEGSQRLMPQPFSVLLQQM